MSNERPQIDLSGGQYDEFETRMSQWLGLKVILVRDWKRPTQYEPGTITITVGKQTEEDREAARQRAITEENALLASLRDNLVQRDSAVGHDLTENDLRSLLKVGHVTLRKGNAEEAEAVLILDPAETLHTRMDTELGFALIGECRNAWFKDFDDPENPYRIDGKQLIENFDLSEEDIRCYRALLDIRYALQHQNEYIDKSRRQETLYWFAATDGWISPKGYMHQPYFKIPYDELMDKLRFEARRAFKPGDFGIKDPEFFEKTKLASAIHSLMYTGIETMAFDTFMRMSVYKSEMPAPQGAMEIQKRLDRKLKDQAKAYFKNSGEEWHDDFLAEKKLEDWRVLFPVFREVYEKDASEGAERAYLDTIMAGLQKWFPTITNGPVPDLNYGSNEPARTLPKLKAKSARAAFRQKPQP